MNTNRWERVGELFEQALPMEPDQRSKFLAEQCGDDTLLRREVDALLESEAAVEDGDFLKPSSLLEAPTTKAKQSDRLIGTRLGVYEIRKRIGQGGMGNVYLATRVEEFKQRVAIKVLKRGMDTDDILRKFDREIRILAALGQHPNIARLLDAGTTDDGLPYFVMEYVEGTQIDEYCDQNRLTIDERLELAAEVAGVVHFAHQHTVIHRDLKPGNIMVDRQGKPRLIDFGIAKITSPELGGDTVNPTRTEHRALTPAYASPEQVRGEPLTTATDVYSLGVLIFELLTGRRMPDVSAGDTKRDGTQRIGPETPRPSNVVLADVESASDSDTTTRTAQELASMRQATPARLRQALRGDLDNLVCMALRNEPRRRYASAGQLAVDIRRYLDGAPIVARPLGRAERLWRICRRHPLQAGMLLGLLMAACFGIVYLSRLSKRLVQHTALQDVAHQSEMLLRGHRYYTQVLNEIKSEAPEAAAELKPPATFTIELFEFLNHSKTHGGTQAKLLSEYPFKMRAGRDPLDEFEVTALRQFERNNLRSYYEFQELDGEPVLRYGIAMRMEQSCCDCHNSHPDSTKTDWKVNDVRGILEVIRPLRNDVDRTQSGLLRAFGWMGVILVGGFASVWFVLFRR